jgi:hypothetical protein
MARSRCHASDKKRVSTEGLRMTHPTRKYTGPVLVRSDIVPGKAFMCFMGRCAYARKFRRNGR